MLYKPFQEISLSRLGMGCMRLPKIDGQGERIDEAKANEIIEYAYENGVNYFDTAYRYHAGESEACLGKALSRYKRNSFYIATKMPGHMMAYQNGQYSFTGLMAGMPARSPRELFEEQLEKCGVDYFDFYLLHNVNESAYGFYTDEKIGVVAYLLGQKQAGRIRHLGFSAHCRPETLDRFLNWAEKRFPGCFEFVQIQLNYMDWTLQEAGKKYEIITGRGLPIMVMEPCRGGRLASLGPEADAFLKNIRPRDSIASWAFRFLQSLPNVQVVLSGMSTLGQIKENVAIFSENEPATDEEKKLLFGAVKPLLNLVPCTVCRYCCEGCPQKLDIPKLISMYDEARLEDPFALLILNFTLGAMAEAELPGACVECGACAKICPQGIDIPGIMQKFAAILAKQTEKR
jgi:predicted aldo/keto reductase-like oxidoreductase